MEVNLNANSVSFPADWEVPELPRKLERRMLTNLTKRAGHAHGPQAVRDWAVDFRSYIDSDHAGGE